MEQVTVKIRGIVSTVRYGTLQSGDLLRTDREYAKFLVNECGAAEFVSQPVIEKAPKRKTKSSVK